MSRTLRSHFNGLRASGQRLVHLSAPISRADTHTRAFDSRREEVANAKKKDSLNGVKLKVANLFGYWLSCQQKKKN